MENRHALRYYRPEYYHEGKKDQCFVTAYEREEVIEEELHLCGYLLHYNLCGNDSEGSPGTVQEPGRFGKAVQGR